MNQQTAIQEVEAQEARRVAAALAGDHDTLAAIYGLDLCYVHASGIVEGHAAYMERLRSGHYVYRRIESQERNHRLLGDDVVLVNGRAHIIVEVQGAARHVDTRFLQVWARRSGAWQLVSWHSTRIGG